MKAFRIIFTIMAIIAAIGVITGHYWHIGTLAICILMILSSKEEEDPFSGRMHKRRCWSARRPG